MYLPSRACIISVFCLCACLPLRPAPGRVLSFSPAPIKIPETGTVSVIDAERLWVGLAHTSDGGKSWVAWLPTAREAQRSFDLSGTSANTFFATERQGWLNGTDAVWTTTDGGQSWLRLFSGHFLTITLADGNSGWMALAEDHRVRNLVTRNGGGAWSSCGQPWDNSGGFPIGSGSFIDANHGWVVIGEPDRWERTVMHGVARTQDGGCNWSTVWLDEHHAVGQSGQVQFLDRDTGWLFPNSYGSLLKTTDGGLHWESVAGPFHMEGGFFVNRVVGWALGNPPGGKTDSGLFRTSDGGKTWLSVTVQDVREDRAPARDIPLAWADGVFRKIRIVHDWPEGRKTDALRSGH